MLAFPNAKINLGLNIVERRPDGYHNLESVFYPVQWREALEIIESDRLGFRYEGIKIPGDSEQNICLQAYQLLKADFDLPPVSMYLLKQIPIGAGLGGGSSDAAFVLQMLNTLFQLGLTSSQLQLYAAKLGSDCVFFIENKAALATKTGTNLESIELDLSDYQVILIYPEIHISTVWAYKQIKAQPSDTPLLDILRQPLEEWRHSLKNDFEAVVFETYPEVKAIKDYLYDNAALYASMSGSGSVVYGIYRAGNGLKNIEQYFKTMGYSVQTSNL